MSWVSGCLHSHNKQSVTRVLGTLGPALTYTSTPSGEWIKGRLKGECSTPLPPGQLWSFNLAVLLKKA